jgi:hypothetical protein
VCSVASNSCHSGARYVHVHYTLCIHVHMTVHVYTYAVVYITVCVVVYLPHPGGIEQHLIKVCQFSSWRCGTCTMADSTCSVETSEGVWLVMSLHDRAWG